ncbi:hypothetical protein K458DRAFT_388906 [Lentithecium fluviatile CBS 122367]|uniref:Uncharacterized protein n=1 Tax=Lentithecium fluviatile CBS 122367 TaxID=1168545 RepID=A0A6G1J1N9_9PLEO|nr:hypothetical protein K458DRAFT_388906 [Lentithecium fluviatile CBS 122367]
MQFLKLPLYVTVYDNLPMLPDAGQMFEAKHGKELINEFRSLFSQHETDRVFGVVLNHRHFNMSPNERLVEYAGTSVPWGQMLDKTRPSSWFISENDDCLPYEFSYSPDENADDEDSLPDNPKYSAFIKSFNQILREKDALGLFGLCRYPGDDFEGRVEITEGRANINFHPKDAPKHLASREAAWFFSPVLFGKCACICGGGGHTSADHQGHVTSR